MHGEPQDAIWRRDEILQVMFWMQGEGLASTVGPVELRPLLDEAVVPMLADDLAALVESGMLQPVGDGRFRLTDSGKREGGRRFQEEFEEMMRQGHGACSDPECDCRDLGPAACAHAHP